MVNKTTGDTGVAEKVNAAVRTAPQTTEFREYDMPDIPDEAALLKVEVAGICGTDVKFYSKPPFEGPVIMGHENIGYIAKAGKTFQKRRGLKEGDLVFAEHYVGCMNCEHCHRACSAGSPNTCTCPGIPSFTKCRTACRLSSPAW